MAGSREQHDRVRDRFTRTAAQFAGFSLSTRSTEADELVQMTAPRGDEFALDVACGPGTFTRAFAPHVRHMFGLDLTPALLLQARRAAAENSLANVSFLCGDAAQIPFRDGALELSTCAYSLHHFADARPAVAELARIVRPGGHVAVVDLIVPRADQADANNRIEKARDASHNCTLTAEEITALVTAAGLRILQSKIGERRRFFDDWMQIAGWSRGHAAYAETRRLMEATFADDAAGFHARLAGQDIEFVQTSFFAVAEKR